MWWQPLNLTLQLMAVSVVISGAIGIPAAWAASSLPSCGRLGRVVATVFLAAMIAAVAMPMILHAAAWEATAGKFGWLPLTQTGNRASGIGAFGAFGGLTACGWIHGLVGSAIVALATWMGVRRVPAAVIAQSQLEVGPVACWWKVRLPIALPWVVTSLLAVAAMAATEMTVADLYRYRTIADEFYLFYASDVSLPAIMMMLFLPIVFAALIIMLLAVWRRRQTLVKSDRDTTAIQTTPLPLPARMVAYFVAITAALLVVAIPVVGLVIKAGHHVVVEGETRTATWSIGQSAETLAMAPTSFASEYKWTFIVALMAGSTAVVIGWIAAAFGRTNPKVGKVFDLLSILLVLVPGPIVGLIIVQLFQLPVPGFRTLYQQTLVPTVLGLLFRAAPAAYWILRSGYAGISDGVLDAARLERSTLARWWAIDRTALGHVLVGAFLASAIVASGDVPVTLPVLPPGVTTVGTRLFGLLHSGARYQEASLALWYVGAVVFTAMIWLKWSSARHARIASGDQ